MGETAPVLGPATATTHPGGAESPRVDALRHAAQEFEAVFLAQVLGVLNQGFGNDLLGDAGGGIFHEMLNDEIAKLISRAGGVGVADAVLREMLKAQEVA
ncbi:MAG TPA: rod-binding protein [Geminicoccaceae bacterium]|nr:rod-binding protein [Geminicoccaceae bacterium]